MNLSCDVVMDLLPLYIDGLASQESGDLVKAHLRTCPDCRAYCRSCRRSVKAPPPAEVPADVDNEKFHQLSARMRKRHIISTSAILGIVALSVAGTLLSVFMTKDD